MPWYVCFRYAHNGREVCHMVANERAADEEINATKLTMPGIPCWKEERIDAVPQHMGEPDIM